MSAAAQKIPAQASSPSGDRLSKRNFSRLAAYIYEYSGIKMPESKLTMLEGRLRRRVRATDTASIDDYCSYVFDGDNLATEGLHLINAVTTNKTDFYREPAHFVYLREKALPTLVGRGIRRVRAWSAACSIGAEPYTIAMELDDYADSKGGPDYGILATDLDTEVLAAARQGIYQKELLEPVPARIAQKYVMQPRDPRRRDVRITPDLRSAIGFGRLNLMDDHYPVGEPMHLIFCRNVLIYFDKPTQRGVVSRLVDCLAPQGYLFLGHSESIAGFDLPLTQVANTVFQRS
ncbi:CheR family methyltransferase [Sphingomonas quercus]|uniref:Chemotaxis protein methyltransferase n=1 Tax=Sphingomonas quercus TaxID=2842451 RepID=A0ABS6BLF1_9SPHN|nr:protein-glutamate O-methyltransferase CheR [Sphingomonas quercus]MBU3078055.1 protein-glutamate O-methyltransferase CheR [Sphingomonas quercus]